MASRTCTRCTLESALPGAAGGRLRPPIQLSPLRFQAALLHATGAARSLCPASGMLGRGLWGMRLRFARSCQRSFSPLSPGVTSTQILPGFFVSI